MMVFFSDILEVLDIAGPDYLPRKPARTAYTHGIPKTRPIQIHYRIGAGNGDASFFEYICFIHPASPPRRGPPVQRVQTPLPKPALSRNR
jgi:hypothetical protein